MWEDNLKDWFSKTKKYIDARDSAILQSPNRIFNTDETEFAMTPLSESVLAPTSMKHVYNLCNNTKTQIMMLAYASAAGKYVPSLIVFQGKGCPPSTFLPDSKRGI